MSDAGQWATVAAGALGTVIGASSNLVGGWLTDKRARKADRLRATSALAAEVHGLITIIRVRRYRDEVAAVVDAFASGQLTGAFKFEVTIPSHYSRVYQAHIEKLGALHIEHSSDLIVFHQLIDSIVQDVTPGGLIAQDGGTQQAFEQLIELFDTALSVGERFVASASKN